MCVAKSLRKAKSRLPLRGALVPSGHRSALDRAGRRECPPVGGGEGKASPAAHVRWWFDEHERSELPWARIAWGATPQALGLQSPPGVWYAKQNPREECLL